MSTLFLRRVRGGIRVLSLPLEPAGAHALSSAGRGHTGSGASEGAAAERGRAGGGCSERAAPVPGHTRHGATLKDCWLTRCPTRLSSQAQDVCDSCLD